MAVLVGHTVLRLAVVASSSTALVGFYLADLALAGRPINAGVVGAINSVLDVAVLFGAVPFGALVDRTSPRTVLVLGSVIGAVATQLFGLTALVPVFFASRALEGLAFAAVNPGVLAQLTDATDAAPGDRGRVMSWFELTLFVGLALGSVSAGPLWERLGTRAFALMALVYLAAGMLFFWGAGARHVSHRRRPARPTAGLRAALADPSLRRLAPAWLAANAVVGLWVTHIVFQLSGPPAPGQYLVGRFSPTEVSVIAFVYALVFGVGIALWGVVLGRMGRVRAMRYAYYGMFGVTAVFFAINRSAEWPYAARAAVVVVYAVLVMVQSGFTPAALAFLADIAGQSAGRGSAMGIYTVLLSLGNIIGAVLGGVLAARMAVDGLLVGTILLGIVGYYSLSYLHEAPVALPLPGSAPEP